MLLSSSRAAKSHADSREAGKEPRLALVARPSSQARPSRVVGRTHFERALPKLRQRCGERTPPRAAALLSVCPCASAKAGSAKAATNRAAPPRARAARVRSCSAMAPRRDDDWPGAASASSRAALFGGLAQRSGVQQQQLHIEESDIEEQLDGLHDRVSRLRRVVGAIDDEAKAQSTMVAELEGAMLRTQAALRETLRKMNRVYNSGGGGCAPARWRRLRDARSGQT